MRKKTILLSLLISSGALYLHGQTTHLQFGEKAPFRKAQNLYLTEAYKGAQHEFEELAQNTNEDERESAEYYAVMTRLIYDEPGAETQFLAFQEKYPESVYAKNGSWELGSFYLNKGDYDKAYTYLTKQDLYSLPERKRNEYQFKLGYVNLMKGNNEKALQYLTPLTAGSPYSAEANFYVGHIYYEKQEYDQALRYFEALRLEDSSYESKILPYSVQIEFNKQQYQKAIEDGKRLLAEDKSDFTQSEVSKIVGESYFKLKDYAAAIPYLEAYRGDLTNADYYQLGYAYYEQGNYEKAVSLFNKIITQKSPLAQTAYFQLGNAYLKTGQKKQALSAYQSASQMNFDSQVQEEAFYLYAKLSYEVGNPYQPSAEALQSFITKYPRSRYKNEIETYLIDAYLSSGNYKSAVLALDKIKNKTQEQKVAEQKATFLYGIELYKEGKLNEAKSYLSRAVSYNIDAETTQRALFWLGEINYKQGQFEEASRNFEKFTTYRTTTPESKEVAYQLGYTYLKLKQYDKAIANFKTYLATNPPGEFKADAKLRLADSYIGAQNNDNALNLYTEIAQGTTGSIDEAAYNRAVVLGMKGDLKAKADALEDFIKKYPVSKYYDNAKLELADTFIAMGDTTKAMLVLDNLIKVRDGKLKAEARLRKGLLDYRSGKDREALKEYEAIAKEYPRTALAQQAIDNAKQIYLAKGDYKAFENWANQFDFYEVNTAEIQTLAYDEAMKYFDDKKYKEAIPLLKSYAEQYPQGNYSNKINYALGESYYQTKQYENAISPLTQVAGFNNENQQDALLRLAQIYLAQKEEAKALLTLEMLQQTATNPAYLSYAQVHLMRLYSENGKPESAVEMANKVLANKKNESSVLQEAEVIKARNLWLSGKKEEAKVAYQKLETASNAVVRAESLYYKAYFLNQEKKYESSNEVIFDLASKYAEQQRWGSKALVLMAENYYHLGDLYQANYTLESVINNYQDFPEVIAEAKALQKKIKK